MFQKMKFDELENLSIILALDQIYHHYQIETYFNCQKTLLT